MDNLYKRGETFNCEKVEENEKMTPTFLNFVMFYVLEKIDARLVKEIVTSSEARCCHKQRSTLLSQTAKHAVTRYLPCLDLKFTPRKQRQESLAKIMSSPRN